MSLPHEIVRQVLNQPQPLAALQRATEVSLPTLRRAVQELTEARWITVVGQAQARGGRPAMLFGLDNSRYLLLGVHLQLPGMRLVTSDLTGHVYKEEKLFDRAVPAPEEAVQAVADYVARVRSQFPQRTLLGVGVASPGFTDPATGDILSIGRVPTWGNFPICRRLQSVSELPVAIANDVDCMAFAEFLHSQESLAGNLAYVGYDEAVKVSLFLQGELYRGALGNAGLIASHLLRVGEVDSGEDVEALLTVHGVNRLIEQRVASLDAADRAPYAGFLEITNPRQRFRHLLTREDADLPICSDVMADLSATSAAAAANIALVIQPDVVVIGGLLGAMSGERFAQLELAIRSHLPALVSHSVLIRQSKHTGQNAAAIGANYHFLRTYLNDPASTL